MRGYHKLNNTQRFKKSCLVIPAFRVITIILSFKCIHLIFILK
ncbi:hypothetical protein SeSPA_A2439 [Salmonella enterica subsp. enterica serovar Saintpaul str. SARA23]|nr:hypothetical protein FORC20_1957 [Salmonella enterica subsp. enterica serovar Typhimurium]EDY26184.1 hypothetical protein SeSPA_A2439 [Salmonella enterica subsp. enterica serovar Saintpaul str. SARA23]